MVPQIYVVCGFFLSCLFVSLVRMVALKFNLVDRVGDPIKIHTKPVPYLGGVGFGSAFLILMTWWVTVSQRWTTPVIVICLCLIAAAVLGLIDDIRGLRPATRLVVELFIGLVVCSTGLRFDVAPVFSLILTPFFIAAVINAVNMFDGLDGLAGGVVALSASGFAYVLADRASDYWIAPIILVAALLGFLIYNWHPARIFMGDTGAYLLGAILAILATSVMEPLTARQALGTLMVIGMPLYDAAATIATRLISGRPVTAGDRSHTYDRLHRRLNSVRATVGVVYMLQVASVAIGVLLITG